MAKYAIHLQKALQRELYHLARQYDTRKRTFEYAGGKKKSTKKSLFIIIFLFIFFHIKIFRQVQLTNWSSSWANLHIEQITFTVALALHPL